MKRYQVSFVQVLLCAQMLALSYQAVYADIIGSDIAVSLQNFLSLPQVPLLFDNKISSFAYMKGGFALENASTTCTFASAFTVGGPVNLHGGELFLATDLAFARPGYMGSGGSVRGNNRSLMLSPTMTGMPLDRPCALTDVSLFLDGDLELSTTLKIRGTCTIDGRGNNINLASDGHLLIDDNATLRLRNLELYGVKDRSLICLKDSSKLVLDNMRWVQTGNYSFTAGSILFKDNVDFQGPHDFTYLSKLTSTIDYDSQWLLGEIIALNIGRVSGVTGREPFYFQDQTSIMRMQDCSVNITASGARLTRGTMLIDGEARFDSAATSSVCGLIFGTGNIADDPRIEIRPGGVMSLDAGHFVNNIVDQSSFLSGNASKKFVRRGAGTYLYSNQNTRFHNVQIGTEFTGATVLAPGTAIYYMNAYVTSPIVDFYVTSTHIGSSYYFIGGSVQLENGMFPIPVFVSSTGNTLGGRGDVLAPIILANSGASITLSLNGFMKNNIALNGGSVALASDLYFGKDYHFTGSGSVAVGSSGLHYCLHDNALTASVNWSGSGGSVILESDASLAAVHTFAGECVLDAKGNVLDLRTAGNLVVRPNGTLTLKDVIITGVNGNNIRCLTDSGKLILDDAVVIFDGDFSFTQGSFCILNNVDFVGTGTFSYQSKLTSTVSLHSQWTIGDDVTLAVGRAVPHREPLYYVDETSVFNVDGANMIITSGGMCMTRGTILVNRDVTVDILSTASTNGLILGDGTAAGDVRAYWGPGAIIRYPRGHIVYKVTTPDGLLPKALGSTVQYGSSVSLFVEENLRFSNLKIDLTLSGLELVISSGKTLSYSKALFSFPGILYEITGQRYSASINYLTGNCELIPRSGAVPLATLVSGVNNRIYGFGAVGGPVILSDSTARLSIGVAAGVYSDITLGGGIVTLEQPLYFGDNKVFAGSGTVDISNKTLSIGGNDLHATSTIVWDGNGAVFNMRSNLKIHSLWTFSGHCTLRGDGNALLLGSAGRIVVGRGSTLTLKDVALKGIGAEKIFCMDNAGKIIFDSVVWDQDSNFTFSAGKFDISNYLHMQGDGTTFEYQSNQRSHVKSRADFSLKGDIVFSYAPTSTDRTLLHLTDETSKLKLNGATLASTTTGMQLMRGLLEIKNHCYISSDATTQGEGIIFGDGVTADNDLDIEILPESKLDVIYGYLLYKNIL